LDTEGGVRFGKVCKCRLGGGGGVDQGRGVGVFKSGSFLSKRGERESQGRGRIGVGERRKVTLLLNTPPKKT